MKIWNTGIDLEVLNAMNSNTLAETLGISFTDFGQDFLCATMPVDQRTIQPMGLLHGGASMALVETLGSMASVLCVDIATSQVVGIEINGNHLRSATKGFVTGRVTPIKIGKTIHVWQVDITDDQNTLVNRSRLSCMIIDRRN